MARSQNQGGRTREAVPNGPTDLSGGSWRVAAKRTLKEYKVPQLRRRAKQVGIKGRSTMNKKQLIKALRTS